jgi:hypothetical protein
MTTHDELVALHHEANDHPTLAAIRRLDRHKALRVLHFLHGAVGAETVQRAIDYVEGEQMTTYDPNCVWCRYSRPGASGDHRDH